MRSDKPRFRSGKSYGKKDRDGFIHRSWMKAGELPEHVFDGRPVIGNSHLRAWTKGRELDIESRFAADEDSKDLKPWLWSGPGTPEHPGDLGYWVGYRIVKTYYLVLAWRNAALPNL